MTQRPINTFQVKVEDLRRQLSTRKAVFFLPFGTAYTGVEGEELSASSWNSELEKKLGQDLNNKALIEGFTQNSDNPLFIVLPFIMSDPTSASANIVLSYRDSSVSEFTTNGMVKFYIGENLYHIDIDAHSTIETLADTITATLNSDGQVTAQKTSEGDTVMISMKTVDMGEISNMQHFVFIETELHPGNLHYVADPFFEGGTDSTNLTEKIILYKKTLQTGNFTQFISPYTETERLNQIYEGFDQVWDNQKIGDVQFVPMLHLIIKQFDDILDAEEYIELNRKYTLGVIPDKGSVWNLMKEMGRLNGDIFSFVRDKRIRNGIFIPLSNTVGVINYYDDTEVEALLSMGLSPLTKTENNNPQIERLVSTWKATELNQPVDYLTNVLGAVWVVKSIIGLTDDIHKRGNLLRDDNPTDGFITTGAIAIEMSDFIQLNLTGVSDPVIKNFNPEDISVIENPTGVDITFSFETYQGLKAIFTRFNQKIGG
ncbi:MAG: hypothetical protein ACRC0X_02130 [Brevinema sp.]